MNLFSFKDNKENKKVVNKYGGFTLVEIIVSLAVFTMVAVIAVGAFLKITDANKKSQTLKTAINNINFALESMTREMRVGYEYYCDTDLPVINYGQLKQVNAKACDYINTSQNVYIAFHSSRTSDQGQGLCNLLFIYHFNAADGTFYKAEQSDCTENIRDFETHPEDYAPIISPDTIIENFSISVTEPGNGANKDQPKIWMRIKGYTGVREVTRTYFDVQTTISQRAPL